MCFRMQACTAHFSLPALLSARCECKRKSCGFSLRIAAHIGCEPKMLRHASVPRIFGSHPALTSSLRNIIPRFGGIFHFFLLMGREVPGECGFRCGVLVLANESLYRKQIIGSLLWIALFFAAPVRLLFQTMGFWLASEN